LASDAPSSGAEAAQQAPSEPAPPRRKPKQPRSQETYGAILAAAGRLFAERGYEETTTHLIAREAGISVGALYRYFADKKAICLALYQQDVSDLRARLLAGLDITDVIGKDLRHVVRSTLALAFDVYAQQSALRRVLSEQSRKIAELGALRRALEAELHLTVQRILSSVSAVSLPDLEASAYLVSLLIERLMDECALYHTAPEGLSQDRLVDAATELLMRYSLGYLP
jgi:AcrR family transcriptional regulator